MSAPEWLCTVETVHLVSLSQPARAEGVSRCLASRRADRSASTAEHGAESVWELWIVFTFKTAPWPGWLLVAFSGLVISEGLETLEWKLHPQVQSQAEKN